MPIKLSLPKGEWQGLSHSVFEMSNKQRNYRWLATSLSLFCQENRWLKTIKKNNKKNNKQNAPYQGIIFLKVLSCFYSYYIFYTITILRNNGSTVPDRTGRTGDEPNLKLKHMTIKIKAIDRSTIQLKWESLLTTNDKMVKQRQRRINKYYWLR